jgi:hypothetical protein
MQADSPRPLIRYLREHGPSTVGELKDAGLPRVRHWLTKLMKDGAVRDLGRCRYELTW